MLPQSSMTAWPEKIETEYQSWIKCRDLFHPLDLKYFARFLWACADDPKGTPEEVDFRIRLAQDRPFEMDGVLEKAQDLFTDFPYLLVHSPNRVRKCLKRAFFKRYGYS
jgi:hypothetical protein